MRTYWLVHRVTAEVKHSIEGGNAMKFHRQVVIASVAAVVSASAFAQQLKPESDPGKLGFDAARLERVTQAFQGYVDSGQLPGAVVLIARKEKVAYFRAFGFRDR